MHKLISKIQNQLGDADTLEKLSLVKDEIMKTLNDLQEEYAHIKQELAEQAGHVDHLNICLHERTRDLTNSLDQADDKAKELFTLLSTIPNLVYFKNTKREFVLVNHAFETWVNINTADIIGKTDDQVYPEFMSRHIAELEEEVLEKNIGIYNFEERLSIDDTDTWLLTSISTYKNSDGETEGLIVSSQDITNHKKHEIQLEKANELAREAISVKNQFLANISHELRTPLHGIVGSTEMLLQKKHDDETSQLLKIIDISSQSLLKQVNDILFFSKKEGDSLKENLNIFEVHEMINHLVESKKALIHQKGFQIRYFTDDSIPKSIKGDSEKVIQLLEIFISNAIKFTENGFIHIVLKKEEIKGNKIRLRFEVIDTGIGIKRNIQQLVFNVFSVGDASLIKRFDGTGLGLSVAKKLLDLLKGEYGFESEHLKGSKFWFVLDFLLENRSDEVPDIDPKDIPVLLVEDNIVNQKIAFFSLKKLGFPVDIAENGKEAVEKFTNGNYRLILMDIQMPIMDGFEATEKIRQIENKAKYSVPAIIIALSANVLSNDIKHCFEVGMNEFISKPFSSDKLLEKIKNYFKLKK